jgi:opacity protein-like surface antigen
MPRYRHFYAGGLLLAVSISATAQEMPIRYGLGIVYMDSKQDLSLDDLEVTANGNPDSAASLLHLGKSTIEGSTVLLKADAWLLPGLNVFAFVGQASNDIEVDYRVNGGEVADYFGSDACTDPQDPDRPAFCDRDFTGTAKRDAEAINYGGGAMLAGARGPAFAALGLVYARSEASGNDTTVTSFSVAPRVGWRFPVEGAGNLGVYVGASWAQTDVEIRGETTFVTGSQGQRDIPQQITFEYSLSQKSKDDWSGLAGLNWDISRNWTLQGEYSLGAREGLLMTAVWRFGS